MDLAELPGMVDAILLFVFLWIAAEQRKMRPDPGPEFDPPWGWSKKVRPLVTARKALPVPFPPWLLRQENQHSGQRK